MTKNTTPLEIKAQAKLIQFCREKGLKHYGCPRAYSEHYSQINENTALGYSIGYPDVWIQVSAEQSFSGSPILLVVEMKREKGGVVNEEQQQWIDFLNSIRGPVIARICKGHESAIKFISTFLNPNYKPPEPEWLKNLK